MPDRAVTGRRGAGAPGAPSGAGSGRHGPRPLLRTMLGRELRRNRLAQGRTLADVAAAAKVSLPYLSELERGRKEGSSEVLAAICDALRIDLADLVAGAGRRLAADRPRPAPVAPVIPLDAVRGPRVRPHAGGRGDARCLLAA